MVDLELMATDDERGEPIDTCCGHCSEPFEGNEVIHWCPLCGADCHGACGPCAYEDEAEAAERGECQ